MEMLISAQDQTRNSLGLAAPSSLAQAGEPSPTTPQCPEIKFTAATNDDINTVIAEDPFTVWFDLTAKLKLIFYKFNFQSHP